MRALALLLIAIASPTLAEDVMLQDFDTLMDSQLRARARIVGDNITARLTDTDERAGKRNLLISADVDPAKPTWNHLRLAPLPRVTGAETLTFWYRGDKSARLYLIIEDSTGVRVDTTIGRAARAGAWHQAIIPLRDLHIPDSEPPDTTATPVDVVAIELYPYPGDYPGKGTYSFHIDDISVTRTPPELTASPLDALLAPVINPGFEELSGDGHGFAGWGFSVSSSAKVSATVSRDVKHSGQTAVLLHDESPIAPHVYGRFLQRVPVQPSTPYRLSCWVKGKGVRPGNHWTDWKCYTARIPSGDFDWQLIELQFVTKPDQTALELGLNVVNVTDELWVDDVSLTTDLTVSRARPGEGRAGLWCPGSMVAESEAVHAKVIWQDMPGAARQIQVTVTQDGKSVGGAVAAMTGPSGTTELYINVPPSPTSASEVRMRVVDGQGATLAQARREIEILSTAAAQVALADASAKLDDLKQAVEDWRRKGLPTDYPTVTTTVVENFIPWIKEDIDRGETSRAMQQTRELDEILKGALAQCAVPPALTALTVPRYRTGRHEISGGHFVADVEWPDGRQERRPVFFCGYGHFTSVRRDVEKFGAYGLNIFQVEFGPRGTVQEDMTLDLSACKGFEALLERAEKASIAVNLLLSPHYFPNWGFEKWPEIGGVRGGFNSFDIDAPGPRQVEEAFLRGVIPRLKDRPGLHSVCLSNEPIYQDAPKSVYNRGKWHDWLKQRHGTIERLNELWGAEYVSFDAVPIQDSGNLKPRPALYDWVSFNNERFAGWHRWMADIIHEIAPDLPVHAKIMNLPFARHTVTWGNDVEAFCDLSQIAGNDCTNNFFHDEGALWGNCWRSEYMYYDLLRSMRGQPVFNSENHIVTDGNWNPVPGMHMRNLIWQGALHGLGASTTWVWERTYDPASSFAGSIMHRPALCDAHGRTALDLMRLAPQMVALQDAPARTALVYSICSQAYNPEYSRHVATAYDTLTFLGEKVDFVTYGQLARGQADSYEVIIVPGVTHFEQEGYRGLARFASLAGKRVITLGEECLARDEYDRPRDASGLQCQRLPLLPAQELRAPLPEAMGLDMPVKLLEAEGDKPAWGIGWRWASTDDGWLVNACNYTRTPKRCRIDAGNVASATDLFTGLPADDTFVLDCMEPVLVRLRR